MNPKLLFPLVLAGALLATPARAQTNSAAITNNDAVVNGYLQIQEQLHATQMAIADIRAAAADDAKRTAEPISAQQSAALANAGAVHQLAGPGRAAVETSNSRLLDVVEQLERKIIELENGSSLLVEAAGGKSFDLLAEGQTLLDAGQPQKALEIFDRLLTTQPDHAEA